MPSLPRSIHRVLNHAMWVMPILVAIVAYRPPGAGQQQASTITAEKREKPAPLRSDVSAVFAELDRTSAAAARQCFEKRSALNSGEIRQRLLELDALPTLDDPVKQMAIQEEAWQLAGRLGELQGAAGVDWMSKHIPVLREAAFASWADKDSDGAFDFIAKSQHAHPCSSAQLMGLIDQQSHGDATALAAAAARVPWELFDPASTASFDDLTIPEGKSQVWLDSGVARSLAEQGFRVSGLFGQWLEADPQQALTAWADWPGSSDSRVYDLEEMLRPQRGPEQMAKLMQAVDQTDISTRTRLTEAMAQIVKNNPQLANSLRERMPNLVPASTDNP